MGHYRSYFLNASSRIISTASFSAADASTALGEARRLLIDHEYRVAAELWRGDQYVGCVLRSDPATNEAVSAERLARCPLLKAS
ncbi:MAG TPA: hypothetical protein VG328_03585 [Stellaceae bacterium]|jgi:hypothetical protein|nr:hypothetical protein [Stellaceae bacterium]